MGRWSRRRLAEAERECSRLEEELAGVEARATEAAVGANNSGAALNEAARQLADRTAQLQVRPAHSRFAPSCLSTRSRQDTHSTRSQPFTCGWPPCVCVRASPQAAESRAGELEKQLLAAQDELRTSQQEAAAAAAGVRAAAATAAADAAEQVGSLQRQLAHAKQQAELQAEVLGRQLVDAKVSPRPRRPAHHGSIAVRALIPSPACTVCKRRARPSPSTRCCSAPAPTWRSTRCGWSSCRQSWHTRPRSCRCDCALLVPLPCLQPPGAVAAPQPWNRAAPPWLCAGGQVCAGGG